MKRRLSMGEQSALSNGYPGTPSTGILEMFAPRPDICAERSPDDRVALDAEVGAARASRRAAGVLSSGF
jgi:indolepyruvate ferredoxin oxidoreductase alpha subunit